jgi:hypothetical protein
MSCYGYGTIVVWIRIHTTSFESDQIRNKIESSHTFFQGGLFRALMASQEVLDEIAAHPGVTQPGQQQPDPSPVEELLGYVRDTWTGPSKTSFSSVKKISVIYSLKKL